MRPDSAAPAMIGTKPDVIAVMPAQDEGLSERFPEMSVRSDPPWGYTLCTNGIEVHHRATTGPVARSVHELLSKPPPAPSLAGGPARPGRRIADRGPRRGL